MTFSVQFKGHSSISRSNYLNWCLISICLNILGHPRTQYMLIAEAVWQLMKNHGKGSGNYCLSPRTQQLGLPWRWLCIVSALHALLVVLPWKINRSRGSLLSTLNWTIKTSVIQVHVYTTTCLVLDWNWNIHTYLIFIFRALVVVRLPHRNQEIVYKCAWLIGI